MRNFILSFVATLIVMFIAPHNTKTIADAPLKDISKKDILPTLEQPVHAQAEKLEQVPVEQPKPVTQPVQASGDCNSWMDAAGITDKATASWLISKESGCRATAQNPRSTAYGIFQFLDSTWAGAGCTKTSDPVQQMVCGQRYVVNRYGSWTNARAFWERNSWY